jgi:hypothetical protein
VTIDGLPDALCGLLCQYRRAKLAVVVHAA